VQRKLCSLELALAIKKEEQALYQFARRRRFVTFGLFIQAKSQQPGCHSFATALLKTVLNLRQHPISSDANQRLIRYSWAVRGALTDLVFPGTFVLSWHMLCALYNSQELKCRMVIISGASIQEASICVLDSKNKP
jgi:hypothetical protein